MKKIIKKEKPIVAESKNYSISLFSLDKEYKFNTDTIFEAFEQLKPASIKGKSILKVSKGNLKAEIVLYPFQVRRLLVNKFSKMLLEKRLNSMLK